jgi:hypothetical protein
MTTLKCFQGILQSSSAEFPKECVVVCQCLGRFVPLTHEIDGFFQIKIKLALSVACLP